MKMHEIEIIRTDNQYLYMSVDDHIYRVAWKNCSTKLQHANPEVRSFIRVSPSGYGLHWPLLDEDLAVTPLLQEAEQIDSVSALVERDPEKLSGTPVFPGTRVPIQNLFDCLDAGESLHEFLEQFPTVSHQQASRVLHNVAPVSLASV